MFLRALSLCYHCFQSSSEASVADSGDEEEDLEEKSDGFGEESHNTDNEEEEQEDSTDGEKEDLDDSTDGEAEEDHDDSTDGEEQEENTDD